jgi:hypothetical protein
MESTTSEPLIASATQPQSSEITPATTTLGNSAAIKRLMDEVRAEQMNGSSAAIAYDRAHNRHNRS